MTHTPSGAPGSIALPEPYPFDPSCGVVPMAEVSAGIRGAIEDAGSEIRMEMRMLGHVRDITPADSAVCVEILRTLARLHELGQQLPS